MATEGSRSRARIVVDDAVVGAAAAFGTFGEVWPVRGAEIGPTQLAEAEALIVRSVTRVDAALLDAAPRLRFVGSATAGVDHIEVEQLRARGIRFAHAPGCNADAVCDWVTAALFGAMSRAPETWARGPVGVVGVGQVGSRVLRRLAALGVETLACDPPRARTGFRSHPLEHLLERCGVVTFHVPLTAEGEHPTRGLVGPQHSRLPALIDTSRGSVVDPRALVSAGARLLVLDVWAGEPRIAWGLLCESGAVLWGSPHVAGYSVEGKVDATRMIHGAMAEAWGVPASWSGGDELGPARELVLAGLTAPHESPLAAFVACLHAACAIPDDDRELRAIGERAAGERAAAFEALRRGYRLRRQYSAYSIGGPTLARLRPGMAAPLWAGHACTLGEALEAVGFQLQEET